jgi:hypothetical protein
MTTGCNGNLQRHGEVGKRFEIVRSNRRVNGVEAHFSAHDHIGITTTAARTK